MCVEINVFVFGILIFIYVRVCDNKSGFRERKMVVIRKVEGGEVVFIDNKIMIVLKVRLMYIFL